MMVLLHALPAPCCPGLVRGGCWQMAGRWRYLCIGQPGASPEPVKHSPSPHHAHPTPPHPSHPSPSQIKLCYDMFMLSGVVQTFRLNVRTLRNFLGAVASHYHAIPYHNFNHVAHVLHAVWLVGVGCCWAAVMALWGTRKGLCWADGWHDP